MTAKVIRFPVERRRSSLEMGTFVSSPPDWATPYSSNPLDDIREAVALTRRMSMQLVRGTVTDKQVEQLQAFARLKGWPVPQIKDGRFLGKVVVCTAAAPSR